MLQFPETIAYQQGLFILKRLQGEGHEAYFVGGCVRNCLMGLEIPDYDITTSALPHEIEALFPHTVDTGIEYGTIMVLIEKIPYEVTTFRGETAYQDGRHPDAVEFGVSLKEDLRRRDFTVNAMAYHPDLGLIDPFEGAIDLEKRILRTVGDPFTRFSEDYLRILRGLRFSVTLNLSLEEETEDAVLATSHCLRNMSGERVTGEIRKMVMGKYMTHLSQSYPVLEEGVFGVDCLWDAEDEEHIVEKWNEISTAPPILSLRLALFLSLFSSDSGSLRLSNQEGRAVDFLCKMPCLVWESTDFFLETIAKYGRRETELLLLYQKCNFPYHRPQLEELESLLGRKSCTSLEELSITGRDLLDCGVKEGPMVGRLLHIALDMVLEERVENDKAALLELLLGKKREEIL